jgi:UPF0755 protein
MVNGPAQDAVRPRSGPPWWVWRIVQVVAVLILIAVVFAGLKAAAGRFADAVGAPPETTSPVAIGNEVTVTIPAGASARLIATLLEDQGIIAHGEDFEDAVSALGVASRLKAGDYALVSGTGVDEIIDILVAGPAPVETIDLTVIEGLTIDEMLASLADQTDFTVEELAAPLLDGTVTSPYLPEAAPEGSEELARWEGLLAPDTYEFRADADPATIVGRLAQTLTDRANAVDWTALEELELTPYDGLIIASLVEREAKLDEERPLIASVIANRLELGIALQIDATIIYALGENRGEVLLEDLEIDSPYNTYLNPGLPPTPIAGVRVASLEAAAAPADTEYLYYVLIDTDGTHGFSATLEEHNRLKEQAKADGVLTP